MLDGAAWKHEDRGSRSSRSPVLERRQKATVSLSKDVLETSLRRPKLGRECELYRWTQDATRLYVEIPLANAPPHTDVSLVIGGDEFAASVVSQRDFEGVRGTLGGAIWPQKSRWEVVNDPPSISVTIEKQGGEGYAVMWQAFLLEEVPSPTVRYAGVCETTGVRFRQYIDTIELELDLNETRASVDVDGENNLRIDSPSLQESLRGKLFGTVVAPETVWLVDDNGTLYITLRKQQKNWWPNLCK